MFDYGRRVATHVARRVLSASMASWRVDMTARWARRASRPAPTFREAAARVVATVTCTVRVGAEAGAEAQASRFDEN